MTDGIFNIPTSDPNITKYIKEQVDKYSDRLLNTGVPDAEFLYPVDVAILILRSMGPLSAEHKLLLEEFETFVYLREKIVAYTSEAFNTTAYPSFSSDVITFYYFLPKPRSEIIVNGHSYAFAPHVDARLIEVPYNRPLRYNLYEDKFPNPFRRYSAVFFFNEVPPNTGGHIHWFDFPNNYNLPPANGTELGHIKCPKTGKLVRAIYSPSFDDPDLKKTTIVPKRAKLIVFAAEDEVHATDAYTGDVERWAFIMQLSDPILHKGQVTNTFPVHFYDKKIPKMNSSLMKHDRLRSSGSSSSSGSGTNRHPLSSPTSASTSNPYSGLRRAPTAT